MSASLVGSEMCIRDRLPRQLRGQQHHQQRPPAKAPWRASSAMQGLMKTCLLYTSDAADDM
eukprot:4025911-Alexandrium_andersonii.AAC.1